jgi:hypothetical protein
VCLEKAGELGKRADVNFVQRARQVGNVEVRRGRVCDVRGRGRQCLLGMGMSGMGVDERVEGGMGWKRMALRRGFRLGR